jgi:hypothetical protein
MACDLANGRVEPCKDSIGGLDAIYFVNYGIEESDITYTSGTDEISDINGVTSLYKYELKGTNSFEQTIQSSRENGTTFFEQVLSIELKKQDLATTKNVKLLAYGRPHIVVRNRAGQFKIAGLFRGMDMTAGTISDGVAMGDFNGYKLTFTGMENVPANFLDCSTEAELATLFSAATIVTA